MNKTLEDLASKHIGNKDSQLVFINTENGIIAVFDGRDKTEIAGRYCR